MKIISTPENIQVKGKTLINHSKRVKLNLNVYEYIFLDAIEQIIFRRGKFNSLTMYEDIYRISGIPKDVYVTIGKKLKQKGVIVETKKNEFVLYEQWHKLSDNYTEEFDVLWPLMDKTGNKKKGLDMYVRARKSGYEYIYLLEKVNKYMKFIKESNQFCMHVSTFFNPQFEEFNNEFKVINKNQKDLKNAIKTIYEGNF
jgi:hypothetical protein